MSLSSLIALALSPFVAVFVHELGHAGFVLWATDDPVHVRVGRQPSLLTASVGRLDLSIHFLMPKGSPAGLARTFASFSWDDSAAFALAGPFANVVLALATAPFLYDETNHLRWGVAVIAAFSAFMAVVNLIPFRRQGVRSDGLVVLDSWRARSR